jgi:hypothetical protein
MSASVLFEECFQALVGKSDIHDDVVDHCANTWLNRGGGLKCYAAVRLRLPLANKLETRAQEHF